MYKNSITHNLNITNDIYELGFAINKFDMYKQNNLLKNKFKIKMNTSKLYDDILENFNKVQSYIYNIEENESLESLLYNTLKKFDYKFDEDFEELKKNLLILIAHSKVILIENKRYSFILYKIFETVKYHEELLKIFNQTKNDDTKELFEKGTAYTSNRNTDEMTKVIKNFLGKTLKITLNHIVIQKKPVEVPKEIEKVVEEKVIEVPKKEEIKEEVVVKKEPEIVKPKSEPKKKIVEKIVKKKEIKKPVKKIVEKVAKKIEPKKIVEDIIPTNVVKALEVKKVIQPTVTYEQDYLNQHLALIKKEIQKQVKYSKRARKLKIEGKVVVEFCLTKSGEIVSVRTIEGHKLLQKSTLNAIYSAMVYFAKVQRNITIRVPIEYRLI